MEFIIEDYEEHCKQFEYMYYYIKYGMQITCVASIVGLSLFIYKKYT